ncbi:pyrroline-5-carboxylate reductase [Novosphingobium sp. PC22D]|uniref:pyrroline-5-carboxylate reductase family protein n=1 Tax=Novosphingobium sp. PC22D TaxID=1962403 RepID=UPI000BF15777|nr:pyrroline-5-carboxylate reductase [Novosphingobium sp. PC22D]PEQ12641.1 pyrroline-5-carboxylate reductase [Novosphingobium sp. PC22D]
MALFDKFLIVGCGNMGGAMLAGWLAGGIEPSRFTVVDPGLPEAPEGVTLLREMPEGAFDAVMLGIKPQMLDQLAPRIAPAVGPETVVFSILAGVEIASLERRFAQGRAVVRIMPNLAAAIGKSPIALAESGLEGRERDAVAKFMQPLGTPEWFDEALFDAVTALAGCGPGFVYRFIDSLAGGAVALGVPEAQARRLALAMVEGAGLLAASSELSPGELADRVASPGGSTRAGLDVLDEGGALAGLVTAAMRAARERNAEMAAAAREG